MSSFLTCFVPAGILCTSGRARSNVVTGHNEWNFYKACTIGQAAYRGHLPPSLKAVVMLELSNGCQGWL